MTIFLKPSARVIVQGMTGVEGSKHTARMLAAGTNIVGGVVPKKGGTTFDVDVDGQTRSVPVFSTVAEAKAEAEADTTVVFVPPRTAKDALLEAVNAQIPLVVVITEGIPVRDTVMVLATAQDKQVRVIGPNSPGIIIPGRSNVGMIPVEVATPGPIGLVSRAGTLTYQMMSELRDVGMTTCVGIGGDPVIGTTYIDALGAFQADPETEVVVLIGEIGGDQEERAAEFISENVTKPVVAYVAGFSAPVGKTMGHAGAIISGSSGTASGKKEALEAAGVTVGRTPTETAAIVRELLA